jgi:hypothetical protein
LSPLFPILLLSPPLHHPLSKAFIASRLPSPSQLEGIPSRSIDNRRPRYIVHRKSLPPPNPPRSVGLAGKHPSSSLSILSTRIPGRHLHLPNIVGSTSLQSFEPSTPKHCRRRFPGHLDALFPRAPLCHITSHDTFPSPLLLLQTPPTNLSVHETTHANEQGLDPKQALRPVPRSQRVCLVPRSPCRGVQPFVQREFHCIHPSSAAQRSERK